jgi:hypothetical protein
MSSHRLPEEPAREDVRAAAQGSSGWLWERVQVGEELDPYEYVVTDEMLARYREVVENPTASYPTVAGRHPLRAFVQRYGKQTLMNVGAEAEYFGAVIPGKKLHVTARITDKYIRRDKPYVVVEATTKDEDGRLVEISRVIGMAAKAEKPLFTEVARKWDRS